MPKRVQQPSGLIRPAGPGMARRAHYLATVLLRDATQIAEPTKIMGAEYYKEKELR